MDTQLPKVNPELSLLFNPFGRRDGPPATCLRTLVNALRLGLELNWESAMFWVPSCNFRAVGIP